MLFLTRKSSGEVLGVSTDVNAYAQADATYFTVVTDPPMPDGGALVPAKMWDGANLRNATGPEITSFAGASAVDANKQARASAIGRLQADVVFRKVLRAIVGQVVVQLNVLRTNPALGLSAITEAQAETAIVSAINAGTFD